MRRSDNRKMLVVAVVCGRKSLCNNLSLWGWYQRNLRWETHGFERLDLKHNYHLWTQWRWDVLMNEKFWTSLWDIADSQSVVVSGYWPHYLSGDKRLLFYLWFEVKYLWFDSGYGPPDFSDMKTFIVFSPIVFKDSVDCWLYKLRQNPCPFYTKIIYLPNVSFTHQICCCFIVCNNFNCLIYQK